jgi:hypothetical protein
MYRLILSSPPSPFSHATTGIKVQASNSYIQNLSRSHHNLFLFIINILDTRKTPIQATVASHLPSTTRQVRTLRLKAQHLCCSRRRSERKFSPSPSHSASHIPRLRQAHVAHLVALSPRTTVPLTRSLWHTRHSIRTMVTVGQPRQRNTFQPPRSSPNDHHHVLFSPLVIGTETAIAFRKYQNEQDDLASDLENLPEGSQDPDFPLEKYLEALGPDYKPDLSIPLERPESQSGSDPDTGKTPAKKRKRASRKRSAKVSASFGGWI